SQPCAQPLNLLLHFLILQGGGAAGSADPLGSVPGPGGQPRQPPAPRVLSGPLEAALRGADGGDRRDFRGGLAAACRRPPPALPAV
ncbi:unnamed protein product, partial [Closterium sp. NIES-53]